jgi:putative SOS response-associated peptidase YedK
MCNRIRGLREWSDLPRSLTRLPLVNFDYNPNVAPTEQVPAFLAERDKPLTCKLARFGINLAAATGKKKG